MKHTWKSGLAIGVTLALALSPVPAFAKQDKPKEHGNGNAAHGNPHAGAPENKGENKGGNKGGNDLGVAINVGFGSQETDIIRRYFGAHPVNSKPLPPGIAKNLQRGKPLPPGIAKRYLPSGLAGQLPVRDGYERLIVGNDALLVQAATGIIVDILSNLH